MGRRRGRKRCNESAAYRVMVSLAWAMLVVLVSAAASYTFYLALQWVATGATRRSLGG